MKIAPESKTFAWFVGARKIRKVDNVHVGNQNLFIPPLLPSFIDPSNDAADNDKVGKSRQNLRTPRPTHPNPSEGEFV